MKTKIDNRDINISWLNSPCLDDITLDFESGCSLDWDVKLDGGSYWARLQILLTSKVITLQGSFEDDNMYDEENSDYKQGGQGYFEMEITLPEDTEISLEDIRNYGSFSISSLDIDLQLSETDLEKLKKGAVSIEAKAARVEFRDC